MSLDKDAWPSSGLLGVNVACARESSQGCFHFSWHYLAGNPSHVGANVDELARSLQHRMVCDKQMRVQNFVMGIAMSCRAVVAGVQCVAPLLAAHRWINGQAARVYSTYELRASHRYMKIYSRCEEARALL
jgi:hypothetical protein